MANKLTVGFVAKKGTTCWMTHDRAARREAKALDLRLYGTLGLLHLGLQKRWLTEAECLARVGKFWCLLGQWPYASSARPDGGRPQGPRQKIHGDAICL